MLALPSAVFGRNLWMFKGVMVVTLAVATVAWSAVAGIRSKSVTTGVLSMGYFCLSTALLSWTGVINADLPYLMAVGVSLLVMSRTWSADVVTRRTMVMVGALGALCFLFRQEGLTVFVALLGTTLVHQYVRRRRDVRRGIADVCTAVGTFVGITLVIQVLLPYQLLPRYPGTGLGNVAPHVGDYARRAGQVLGFYDAIDHRVESFGAPALGWVIACVVVGLGVAGLWTMVRRHDTLDVAVVLLLGAHLFTTLTFPYVEGRYVFTPLMVGMVIVAQGAGTVGARAAAILGKPRFTPAFLVLPLLLVHVSPYLEAARRAADYRRVALPYESPYEANVQEMFAAIRDHTALDDVIAGGHARTITLFTDRRAVQVVGDLVPPPEADWWVADIDRVADGDEVAWSNDRYALVRMH